MLIPTSPTWRGTSGKPFKNPAEFAAYFGTLTFGGPHWNPIGVMIHNTSSPDGKQWDATTSSSDPEVDGKQRLLNLTDYYRNPDPASGKAAWNGGPHLFVDDDRAFEFNPLEQRGTHCSCDNATHIGIEMVGDFDIEAFASGRGALVRDFTVGIVAAIMSSRGMDPDKLLFHSDCRADNHACPGRNVIKGEMIARVKDAMSGGDRNAHFIDPPANVPVASAFTYTPDQAKDLQRSLAALGAKNAKGNPLDVDGWLGNDSKAALTAIAAKL